MNEILKKLGDIGLVPVVKIDDVSRACGLAQALIDGGLPCAEITFRTAAAADAISAITKKFPEMLVGAGTVINVDYAKRAKEAGAKFIVAPGFKKPSTTALICRFSTRRVSLLPAVYLSDSMPAPSTTYIVSR